jgi:glutamate--cysteine ligase
MSGHGQDRETPISEYDDLLRPFHAAEKPPVRWRIGAEMEKPGVDATTGAVLPYEGDRSVMAVLDEFIRTHGWASHSEYEGGPRIALFRNDASITLEPGGQLELSGAPLATVHDVCSEFRDHMRELRDISKRLDVRWLGVGFHPFARLDELPWVPKDRYKVMREYLPTRGAHAIDMMQRTCTVQANYDYADEADAMRKMRVALKLAPLTTAMFANSPWLEGDAHGGLSYRARVWLDVDPDRSGLLPALWREGAGYRDYVEWALDVPMFMFKRGRAVFANTGQTFRAFWKDGFQGERPTFGDWQTHLNTLFPEVRLKNTIEVRGADAQCARLGCALPALWTGLFYDSGALAAADALTRDWEHDEVAALRTSVWRLGLATTFRGEPLARMAERLLAISEAGLERRGCRTNGGKDERVHLASLKALVEAGRTPADKLLASMRSSTGTREQILRLTDIENTLALSPPSLHPPP